ncbi:MAG: recombination mediator RecR [Anaeroplasmataceae bacterium]
MEYPKSITDLIESFRHLPSIGAKTAERLALYVYSNMSEEDTNSFANNLINIKKNLKKCSICGNLTENDICEICADNERDKNTIMVVETVKDLFVLEKLNVFKGLYHVLNGAINFQQGIGVEDLEISSLIERVKKENIKELIIATNATLEGETTARYIKALLEDYDINITRIAHGLPVGGDITYADEVTVLKALEGRRNY